MKRGRAQRTNRRWRTVVGLVGPDDVRALQTKVHDYRTSLQMAVDGLATKGTPLPIDGSAWSVQQWANLVGECTHFEGEDTAGLLYPVFAGAAYERGRQLISQLDGWRDHLASLNAPSVPAPMPVPNSDLGITGGIGFALAALVAILALRELR